MALKRFTPEPLVFPMPNGKDYEVPPVDIDRGWRLSQLMARSQDELKDATETDEDLFKLAMTEEVWGQMRTDGVAHDDAFRAGMSALAHYQTLESSSGPREAVHAAAMSAAEAIWESGIHPEAVAAWAAANLQQTPMTSPATAEESAATASTSGTSSPKKATARASRSTTSSSKRTSSSSTSKRSTASRSSAAT